MARFLSIGESPPMDSLLSRTILICLRARVASHSLHFLKVGGYDNTNGRYVDQSDFNFT